ncbi:hypothetical protein [uncultured Brevundimonas sp.]|uniref:hypothetical protein n=1 Tax=uncultured Brevundimonas sp. TaxID=213418 RepID=UPI00261D40F4|nr:hypothetical protein [uncultured Brevundimonas sp.]
MHKTGFDPGVAVVDAINIVRRHPWRMLGWGLLMYLPMLVVMLALVPMFVEMAQLEANGGGDPSPASAILVQAASNLGQLAQLAIIVPAIAALAFMVWQRPRAKKTWLGMRYGMDELRVLVLVIAYYFGVFLVMFVAIVAIGLISVPLAMVSKPLGILVGVLGGLAAFAGFVWVGIRAVLILPASVDSETFAFVEGWKASKGRFWPLFAVGLLSFLALVAFSILAVVILGIIVLVVALPLGFMSGGDWGTANTALAFGLGIPAAILGFLLLSFLQAVSVVMYAVPWYSVWAQMTRAGVLAPAEVVPPATEIEA